MPRMIDVDSLIDFIDMGHLRNPLESCFSERDVVDMLESRPTIELVRCGQCKHWKKGDFQAGDDTNHLQYGGRCPLCRFARYENDFCSYGERKEGAENG